MYNEMRKRAYSETIDTIDGPAKLFRIEEEDANGKWNDNYSTRDGYYVIHEDGKHYVYRTASVTKKSYSKKTIEFLKFLVNDFDFGEYNPTVLHVLTTLADAMENGWPDDIHPDPEGNVLYEGEYKMPWAKFLDTEYIAPLKYLLESYNWEEIHNEMGSDEDERNAIQEAIQYVERIKTSISGR